MNCQPHDDAHTEECIKGTNPCDSYGQVANLVYKMGDQHLTAVWDALLQNRHTVNEECGINYNGVDYPAWCEIVYSEIDRRGLTHQ